jgi:hypothetical protein
MMRLVIYAALALPAAAPAHTPLQPFAQAVRALESALSHLGEPLSPEEKRRINDAVARADEEAAVAEIEDVLDAHALAIVEINPESRVKVTQGRARPALIQGGTCAFLVKVINDAGVTAPLVVESPNSAPVSISSFSSGGSPEPPVTVRPEDVLDRWAEISLYKKPPLRERLSGFRLEYQVLLVGSRDAGQLSAKIAFNVGQGSQDIGFRNDVRVLFDSAPAHPVTLRVRDEKGRPSVAAFRIRDGLDRLYPLPAKRLAPDLPFQPQVYRADGDVVRLPAGRYSVSCSRGPEYLSETKELQVSGPAELSFALSRWIDPAKLGWYSGDHDLEVSGFPSSHAGHLVLLGLQDQDYPGTRRIEDWPSWDLPILRWAKAQGAVAGFAHSGLGLLVSSNELPNYDVPGFDGIGANEYVVDVTHPGSVDFISAGDTPYTAELNVWYHTLNVGFRTRISGETDFPASRTSAWARVAPTPSCPARSRIAPSSRRSAPGRATSRTARAT